MPTPVCCLLNAFGVGVDANAGRYRSVGNFVADVRAALSPIDTAALKKEARVGLLEVFELNLLPGLHL